MVACTSAKRDIVLKEPTFADSAMVVSAHPLATRVGLDILRKGGNAVDASIATQLALAVVFPAAGNLGGGGFMVLRLSEGTSTTLDYRETAPTAATTDMFLDKDGNVVPGLSESTHLASGVPGTVAGLWAAHTKYGKIPWNELVQPAIDLASKGFALTEREARGLNRIREELLKNNTVPPAAYLKENWSQGDIIVLTDLAKTLERIRDEGRDGFYDGRTALLIEEEMKRGNGLISANDLRTYEPVWRDPLTATYRGYAIVSMAPASSGGVALIQLLKSVEPYPLREWGHNSAKTIHLFTEAQRRVYADRAAHLGDPAFYHVPVEKLLDTGYIRQRMGSFNPAAATPSSEIREGVIPPKESPQTTHLSIVDQFGNAVAVTTTLNDSYGSKIVIGGAGFLMNNEMDDFSVKPGHPNMYGAIGGEANKIEPGKRMLSSMTPAIVEKDGRLFMVVGTPGGTTIITSVFQTIVNVIDFGMGMQDAVSAGRVHSQWLPDEMEAERHALDEETVTTLTKLGHKVEFRGGIGRVDAILVLKDGKLEGGADPRGDDAAAGF